jgi:hypothetical protein
MKSEHRHDLETNELAKRLAVFLDRLRPYSTPILSALLVVVGLIVAGSYVQSSSAFRKSEAWNDYNLAVEGLQPDLDLLKQSAEAHADSTMAEWSNITWADGQLFRASRLYIQNRAAANEMLKNAENAYDNLIRNAEDLRIKSRAHFGLARVYEMRSELDKATKEYALVEGAFADLAKQRVEALQSTRAQEVYNWLATAPTPRAISGEGGLGATSTGQTPEFDADPLDISEEDDSAAVGEGAAGGLDEIFKQFEKAAAEQTSPGGAAETEDSSQRAEGEAPSEEPDVNTPE